MAGKAYLISSGSYSDYHIMAVFTDKKKAKLFRSIWNKTHSRWWQADIEEWDLSDDLFNLDREEVLIEYSPEDNYAIMSHVGYDGAKAIDEDRIVQKKWPCSSKNSGKDHDVFQFMLDADVVKPDDEDGKLKKIAQDRYAQYNARMEGVG